MTANTEKFTIVGLDTQQTRPSQYPEATSMRQFFFKLSGFPDHRWASIFNDVHQRNFHMRKRHAWIEGGNVLVDCTQDEIELQLEILKPQIAETNTRYALMVAEQDAEANRRYEEQLKEKESLIGLAEKLKFD